ncbi:MAG: RelA/SpoT family protein, partial [Prevotella sp.]|nr:RelA/SpoT family protein [Prevotella sp.]
IVDGLTKISGGIFGDHASAQAENFKKLLLTMSDDIRVILIKICDRLHNMRTLASQPANKQYKIAGETLYIYAPLANRLGLNKIKTELEDLSFRYEHPQEYADIVNKLSFSEDQRNRLFEDFTGPIREALDKIGIEYYIKARIKSPYSIWSKMQNKHVTFDEIYDILAVRIIFTPKKREDEINDCFQIYVALNKIYKSHPDRLRDWVNHPKANGYQALHATMMSRRGQWIEVQIRSYRMDEIAEQGFAAHWKYKEGEAHDDEMELNKWIGTIKEILDDPQPDAMDFLDSIKLNLFASEIFVFTPKGEVKTMPAGCTVLDFAFQLHSYLGSHCIGAKVNHRLVPLSHKLQSGDQVEVLTSKSQHVRPEWVTFVSTARAKNKIQAILRKDRRDLQKKGEEVLDAWLKKNGQELSTSIIDRLCEIHETQDQEALLTALGDESIILGDKDFEELLGKTKKDSTSSGWRKFVPFIGKGKKDKPSMQQETPIQELLTVNDTFNKKLPCIIREDTIGMYLFPHCCHPIPGDDILGFIDSKKHIEIHKRSCPVAVKLKSSFGPRILDAKWDMHRKLFFDATIEVEGIDRKGIFRDVAEVISDKMNVNIHRLSFTSDKGIFQGKLELRVHDREEVKLIMNRMKKVPDLKEVRQIL